MAANRTARIVRLEHRYVRQGREKLSAMDRSYSASSPHPGLGKKAVVVRDKDLDIETPCEYRRLQNMVQFQQYRPENDHMHIDT